MIDTQATGKKKKWTLMFFFASDNTLSPSTLPQLKAIKAAGSSDNANVLVYFDPNEKGAPTRVFAINEEPTPTTAGAGSSGDPIISVLSSDHLKPEDLNKHKGGDSRKFAASLKNSDLLEAFEALDQFLGFCREAYPAEKYMLFLVGHGLVVGRDAFLPDDNPDSAIGLKTLGGILSDFTKKIGKSKLEFIGMHSCSMSAVEIAYELQGTASYMLASQGLSFVGSWPYRQLLTKIYKDIAPAGGADIGALARSLQALCIQYGVDFMHAGYSADMCLCSLDSGRVNALTEPISNLSKALQEGITIPRCRDLIVLAHWRSQSYWQETYTDLCDFCLCLKRLCRDPFRDQGDGRGAFEDDVKRIAIITACDRVIETLKPENGKGPVVCTDYVGPDLQFSHGLSIYFPWSDPREDENDKVIDLYGNYAFTKALTAQQSWLEFLDLYFERTKRPDRMDEEQRADTSSKYGELDYKTLMENLRESFPAITATSTRDFFPMSVLEGKVSPADSTGGACSCASIKNHSRVFSMSPGAATVFDNTKLKKSLASGSAGKTNPKGGTSQSAK
jgi:hypothetical protein